MANSYVVAKSTFVGQAQEREVLIGMQFYMFLVVSVCVGYGGSEVL